MINLEKISGLPIEVTDDFHLKFNPPLREFPLTFARKFAEMESVLLNPPDKVGREETYYVYRGLALPQHENIVRENYLSYDVTILPPMMLGKEFNKTLGHYHAPKPGTNVGHPEVYEVLSGEGLFLIQKMDEHYEIAHSVLAILAKPGEKVIYPPNYGHIIVNIGPGVLATGNWNSTKTRSLYEPIVNKRGMSYYVVTDETERFKFVPNQTYQNLPPVRMIDTRFMSLFAVTSNRPMYTTGTENPQSLDFLANPEKYVAELSAINS